MKFVIFLAFIILLSCTPKNIENQYYKNVIGVYQDLSNPYNQIHINNFGTIYQNDTILYVVHSVLTPTTAIYYIIDSSKGSGYIPAAYMTDILYLGSPAPTPKDVDTSTLSSYALKIN